MSRMWVWLLGAVLVMIAGAAGVIMSGNPIG